MNILFISTKSAYHSSSYGGAESSMQLLAERLAKKGHIAIYVTKREKDGLIPRFKSSCIRNVHLFVFQNMRGGSRLKFIGKLNSLIYEIGLIRLISKYNIQLSYCFYQLSVLEQLIKLRNRIPGLKIVMRMAGLYWYNEVLKKPGLIRRYKHVFNQVDAVNYIYQDLEIMVQEKLNELDMPVVFRYTFTADIGSSVKVGREKPYILKDDKFLIIMAGRFSDYAKRQDILVQAASIIDPAVSVNIKLIGDGVNKGKIKQLIEKYGVEKRVKIVSFLEQNQLWEEMQQADLLCHACDYEGLGKIIIESMALGLPVLASNVVPLNSYIKEGYNGFLVDNEPELWAKKIEALIYNEKDRNEVSENTMEYIKQNYNPQINVAEYEKQFDRIIKRD